MNFTVKSVKLWAFWEENIDSSWRNIFLEFFFGLSFFFKMSKKKPELNSLLDKATGERVEVSFIYPQTQAKTPNLATRGRARGPDPNILSQTQREEAELRGRQPFKAQPPRIPAKPIGIPQVKAMQPVVPESPAFALKQRMETRKRQQGDYDSLHNNQLQGDQKSCLGSD